MGRFLTFDLGAESGRAVLGTINAGNLQLEVLHVMPEVEGPPVIADVTCAVSDGHT